MKGEAKHGNIRNGHVTNVNVTMPATILDVNGSPTSDDITENHKRFQSSPCVIGCSAWCRKFFWEGQLLNKEQTDGEKQELAGLPWHHRGLIKYRRLVAMAIPFIFFHFCWWGVAIQYNIWYLFKDKFYMTITMIFGSIIAGMTSEGGGAIAFPVMTLAFSIPPSVARDFSLMIQSCGMTAAAFSVFFMKVKLERHSLGYCSLGGVAGTIFGLHIVDPNLTAPQKKMIFVSIWFSFAFTLFLLNLYHKRKTYFCIPDFGIGKAVILICTGILGGIFTSFAGSGLDICSFSMLTLLFRISEKVATPTSVVLMAGNTLVGFYWRGVMMREISNDAWQFLFVCVPVVVIGAPLGSVLGTHFHRHVLASFVYIIDTVALIGAFVLVKQTKTLIGMSVSIIIAGFIFFFVLTKLGEWLMKRIERCNVKLDPPAAVFISSVENTSNIHETNSKSELVSTTEDLIETGFDNPAFLENNLVQKL